MEPTVSIYAFNQMRVDVNLFYIHRSFSVAYPDEERLLQGKVSLDDFELACEETDSCGDGFYG